MDINWEPIIAAVFAVINAVAVYILAPYIKSKLTAAQQEALSKAINTLVAAAEQIFKGSGRGAEKKAYVVESLKEQGITVDAQTDSMIEAAVYGLDKGTTSGTVTAA